MVDIKQDDTSQEAEDTFLQNIIPPSTEQLLVQLEEVVRMALDAEHQELKPGISFPEVMKNLMLIQQAIETIAKDQISLDSFLSLLKERYGPLPKDSAVQKEEARVLERLKNLQTICEAARERLHGELSKNPQVEKEMRDMLEEPSQIAKRKVVRRKRKFRSMGGDGGSWLKT